VVENDIVIVGGGASGFFAAGVIAKKMPNASIIILERGQQVMEKIRISGGGRCNVTHACFEPSQLIQAYPRGNRELLGPFNHFACGDTIEWLEQLGVHLKIEEDGRMFPTSDKSQTIIDALWKAAHSGKLKVMNGLRVTSIKKLNQDWLIETPENQFKSKFCIVASGSSAGVWAILSSLGHHIVPAVPSLFSFHIKDPKFQALSGISCQEVAVSILSQNKKDHIQTSGPILITHQGVSGPAVLKLSAWAAREFHEMQYKTDIVINWVYPLEDSDVADILTQFRKQSGSKNTDTNKLFHEIPTRLWKYLLEKSGCTGLRYADMTKSQCEHLINVISKDVHTVSGKSTFKEEFVTAGGLDLREINTKSFESKLHPGLFVVGEALNIDAITGGYNFQSAWTTGWLAAHKIIGELEKVEINSI